MDTLTDGIRLLPFLFITYLAMEYIEHKTSSKARRVMKESGKWGPVFGGVLGIVPQCGFSTAASSLYAGRIITLGTLFAVYLSTSDEMLPVLLSEQAPFGMIAKILAVKAAIGMLAGFLIDAVICRKRNGMGEELRIGYMCDQQNCNCGKDGILKPAFNHTLQVFTFILAISFLINLAVGFMGEEKLTAVISDKAILGVALAGSVGLIPGCAPSVALTRLYLEGVLGAGAMMAGLLAGSGSGLLVLYRVNDDIRENIKITLLLYIIGVLAGILIEQTGLAF